MALYVPRLDKNLTHMELHNRRGAPRYKNDTDGAACAASRLDEKLTHMKLHAPRRSLMEILTHVELHAPRRFLMKI
jgi:hypothetical protein